MNFLNRAWKNVTRKPSKSILLALTFFIIGNFVIIGLGVSNAASTAKVLARQKMRAVVSYEIDHERIQEMVDEMTDEEREEFYQNANNGLYSISTSELVEFMEDSRVKAFNAISYNQAYGNNGLQSVPIGNKADENREENGGGNSIMVTREATDAAAAPMVWIEPEFMLMGNPVPNTIEITEGTHTIKEGRFYTQEDIDNVNRVCVITEQLAEQNNLRVGDTIQLSAISPNELQFYQDMGVTEADILIDLEIIGIISTLETIDPSAENFDWMSRYESPYNKIYLPSTTMADMTLNMQTKVWDYYVAQFPDDEYYQNSENRPTLDSLSYINSAVFLIDDPLHVDAFVEEHNAKLQGENVFRVLDANNETFEKLSRPLDTLSLFSNFIVWLVVINAIVIITLVTALTLKTREFEIGVLMSIGVSKVKMVGQLFVELSIIAVLGFTMAVVSGSLTAKSIGKSILEYQLASSADDLETEENDYVWIGDPSSYFTEITLEDMISEYEVEISPFLIAEIYIAGLGIVLISILIPSMMVMRFNPKKILMSTN